MNAAFLSTFKGVFGEDTDSDDDLSERARLKKTTNSLQKQVLHLLSENKRLRQRDAMHVCSVLKSNLQPRSCALVENSLFSHTLSYPDDVVDSIEVDILQSVKKLKPLSTLEGTFGRVHVYTMLGRRCVFKTYPSEKDLSSLLERLAHEYRIVKFVGSHPSLCEPLGLFVQNSCFLVSVFESDKSIQSFPVHTLQEDKVIQIVLLVADALRFLHYRCVIHNHIVPANVLLKSEGLNYKPVLVGFSLACRVDMAKCFTPKQQSEFKDFSHFPPEVKTGKEAVSYSSDIFSFGVLLQHMSIRLVSSAAEKKLNAISKQCTRHHLDKRPNAADLAHIIMHI